MSRILYGTPHFIGGAAPLFTGSGGGDGLLYGRATGCAAGAREAEVKSLAESTWAEIADVSAAGKAANCWSVGDEKNITLTTGETLTLQIYGFDHDNLASGTGKAGITFGMKNLMVGQRVMNSTNTNVGGFTGSAMYTWLTGTLMNSLPSDVGAVLKSVYKKTSAGNNSTTINTNSMKVFLFAEIEIFNLLVYSVAGEGSQYQIFMEGENRIKYLSNGSGAIALWWERSPRSGNTTMFTRVTNVGGQGGIAASTTHGVCFGFCV